MQIANMLVRRQSGTKSCVRPLQSTDSQQSNFEFYSATNNCKPLIKAVYRDSLELL